MSQPEGTPGKRKEVELELEVVVEVREEGLIPMEVRLGVEE